VQSWEMFLVAELMRKALGWFFSRTSSSLLLLGMFFGEISILWRA
jgi:hypothetical protein